MFNTHRNTYLLHFVKTKEAQHNTADDMAVTRFPRNVISRARLSLARLRNFAEKIVWWFTEGKNGCGNY